MDEDGLLAAGVGGQVVHDDMDLALTRLCRDDVAQELDEGRARMTRHRLADDLESRAIAP
jgi:hypothetical protein